jgi:hypothetical protein
LTDVVRGLSSRATLVWLDTADHGNRVLTRKRRMHVSVFEEMAAAVDRFIRRVALNGGVRLDRSD